MIEYLPLLPRDKLRLIITWDLQNQISSTLDSAFQASSQEISVPICFQRESQSYIARYPRAIYFNKVSPSLTSAMAL